jgi:hypothetical protein
VAPDDVQLGGQRHAPRGQEAMSMTVPGGERCWLWPAPTASKEEDGVNCGLWMLLGDAVCRGVVGG